MSRYATKKKPTSKKYSRVVRDIFGHHSSKKCKVAKKNKNKKMATSWGWDNR